MKSEEDMLEHMETDQLREYAATMRNIVFDASLPRTELLAAIRSARAEMTCSEGDMTVMQQLLEMGENRTASPTSMHLKKPTRPPCMAEYLKSSQMPAAAMAEEDRQADEQTIAAQRQSELVMQLSHDVLGFPYEEWQCSSPRNRALPLPPELWPSNALETAEYGMLSELCIKGVPHAYRPRAWTRLCREHRHTGWQVSAMVPVAMPDPGEFQRLLDNNGEPVTRLGVDRDIEKDLHRTFPTNPQFINSHGPKKLEKLLTAYSRRNPKTGYCQGMNFVAATLLLTCGSCEVAYEVMCFILEAAVPGYFSANLAGVLIDVGVIRLLLEDRLPLMHVSFEKMGYDIMVLLPRWLCTLMVNILPSETALRLWDAVLVHGRVPLIGTVLVLFARAQTKVLALVESSPPGHIDQQAEVLMHLDAIFRSVTAAASDADQLMAEVYGYQLTAAQLLELTRKSASQYSEQQAVLESRKFDLRMSQQTNFSIPEIEKLRLEYVELVTKSGSRCAGLDVGGLRDVLGSLSPRHGNMASLVHHAFDDNQDGWVDMKEMCLGLSTLCKGTCLLYTSPSPRDS
eukprot:TRINITY_DN18739_c0_g2_i1.p1 TRINITY_DN18739_c0_g2~~TRINITY_DN18739_c0_g2_i1.p1  ORF type:complete len:570 (-),score=130.73 TRINITY_DN18739_c0_g2_i1:172-1881(-)